MAVTEAQAVDTEPAISSVGVVIVCCMVDRWELLLRVIERVSSQTLKPAAIVVVVDHNDALLARLLEAGLPQVTVVASRGPAGASGARNTGATTLETDYVAFLDDDVDLAADWLARLTHHMHRAEIVGAGGCVIPEWETREPWWFPRECGWVIGVRDGTHAQSVRNVWSAGMVVDRAAFIAADGFRADFGKLGRISEPEDTELCLRLSLATGRQWLFDPEARMLHHVRAEQASIRYFLSRCWMEGRGKAALRALATPEQPVLVEERAFVTRILPHAMAVYLRTAIGGDPAELGRAALLTMGTLVTCVGFVAGLLDSSPTSTRQR